MRKLFILVMLMFSVVSLPANAASSSGLIIGDSLTVGASPLIRKSLPGWRINAMVGRSCQAGLSILAGSGSSNVVFALGTNSPCSKASLRRAVAGVHARGGRVAFVNVALERSYTSSFNGVLGSLSVPVVDWRSVGRSNPQAFAGDGVHLRPAYQRLFAGVVVSAANSL